MPTSTQSAAPLTKDLIVDAALAVVEKETMDALSMRRVARELGRAPMSLYRHVGDIDELTELVMERLIAEVDPVDHGPDWRRTLREGAVQVRRVFVRYPGIIEVAMASGIRTETMLRVLDTIMGAFLTAGLTPEQAVQAHRVLFSTILGDTLMQRSADEILGSTPEAQYAFMEQLTSAADDRFPNILAVAGVWPDVDGDRAFAFAIDRVLDGIAALAAEE